MKEGAFLNLRTTGDNLDFDYIDKITGLKPDVTFRKGQRINDKHILKVIETDIWQSGYEVPEEQLLDDAVINFLKPCENRKFFDWPKGARVEFYVSVYPTERPTSVKFSKELLKMFIDIQTSVSVVVTGLSDFHGG